MFCKDVAAAIVSHVVRTVCIEHEQDSMVGIKCMANLRLIWNLDYLSVLIVV